MKKRNMAIDMAKGISLLTLPAIHSTLFYSSPDVFSSNLGAVLALIAENLGAPVFLLTMGLSVTLSSKKSSVEILKRSLKLLLLGYLLNVLKFGVPQLCAALPDALFYENNISHNAKGIWRLIIIGDILQLAAICYLLCGLLYRLKNYGYYAIVLLVVIVFIAPIAWRVKSEIPVVNIALNLFNGTPPDSFFPFFPWGAYPLMGLLLGYLNQEDSIRFPYTTFTFIAGSVVLVFGLMFSYIEPGNWKVNFYRLGPGGTSAHLGAAILVVWLCKIITDVVRACNPILRFLTFLSRNVTAVYMIQWVVVCWGLPFYGYHSLGLSQTYLAIATSTSLTILFSFLYAKYLNNENHI